jgi:hypothetical protein
MAVYKIFPEKSATIYSFYPSSSTGNDEILELSTFESINSTNEVSRVLIKFPSREINSVITDKVSGSTFDTYLKLSLANASSIPLDYTIFTHPLSADWNRGTGRLGNVPVTTDGVSWEYRSELGTNPWQTSSYTTGTTGSYYLTGNAGGANWWTSSNYQYSQSFTSDDTKDIEIKTTNIVSAWYSSSISNYGFILKHSSSLEFTSESKFELKYFSDNTHTIYPPCLEIRWNDTSYSTGSLSVVTSSYFSAVLNNNKAEYQQDSIQKFRITVRDLYPSVTFRTSLNFANQKALPSTSYWAIKDLDTEEMVVDYDTVGTKIGCDSNSNYFTVYMNGLEPERYYKILIKSVLTNGETIVMDKDYIFKVIR